MTYFLDDDIVAHLSCETGIITADKYVTYEVNMGTYYSDNSWHMKTVFYGKCFMSAGQTSIDIDITDIVRNYRYVNDFKTTPSERIYNKWTVSTKFGTSNTYYNLGSIEVFNAYRYTHSNYDNAINFDAYARTTDLKSAVFPMLQSAYMTDDTFAIPNYQLAPNGALYNIEVLPHYPFIDTDNLSYRGAWYLGYTNLSQMEIIVGETSVDTPDISAVSYAQFEYVKPLSELAVLHNGEDTLYMWVNGSNERHALAEFDMKPAHYYLQWQDRFGGVQCQAFDAKDIYSEDFSYTKIENYQGHRRNGSLQVTQKWELTTKWLNDNELPIYEGIFVSPYLQLYDTELDKTFKVIVSDKSYTEKTHRNQRNLYKLTINVELDKNQNVLA